MKRIVVVFVALLALAAGAAAWLWLRPARPKPETSFLVVVVDSMRADHLGAYGYQRSTTPRLDAMAREGVVFEHALSQAPWTRPSVASIFTSAYLSVHRVLYSEQIVGGERRTDVLNEKFLTLAEAMQAGGFATGGFGQKIHLRSKFGFMQGFDAYDMELREAEKVNRKTLAWLRSRDPDRFFVYLHYNDPHYPYRPRAGYARFGAAEPHVQINGDTKKAFREGKLKLTEDDRRQLVDAYDGEILYADHCIGDLIDGIGRLGYGKLFVIVTADHGEEFLDHGDITHGQSLFGELVHVPFIVTGTALPDAVRGRREPSPVQLIDIYPTLLAWAGLPAPPDLQGRSAADLLRGAGAPGPHAEVYTQRREPEDPDFSDAVYDGRWKLIRDRAHGRTMLFDLTADPGERSPIETSHQDVAADLTRRLEAWSGLNQFLYAKIRPEETVPLDPETEKRLKSLGYIQ